MLAAAGRRPASAITKASGPPGRSGDPRGGALPDVNLKLARSSSSWVFGLGRGTAVPLQILGKGTSAVWTARVSSLFPAPPAALLVINRVVALIVGRVRADRN